MTMMDMRQKLERSRKRLAQLQRLLVDPKLSPEKKRVVKSLLRSQKAAVSLGVKALAHERRQKLH
jgi:hypothetical protein